MKRAWYQLLAIAVCLAVWLGAHHLYAASTESTFGELVANSARRYLAVRYGDVRDGQKLDCSGLVQQAFARNGVFLPRRALELATVGEKVSRSEARAGDLLFFASAPGSTGVRDVGVALGNGRMIHASTSRQQVVIDTIDTYFEERLIAVRRVTPADTANAAESQPIVPPAHAPVVASAGIGR